jgi:hypothetical protein
MRIVGVGCGPGMLTEEAIHALKDARRVYGSRRAIEIAGVPSPGPARSTRSGTIPPWTSPGMPSSSRPVTPCSRGSAIGKGR